MWLMHIGLDTLSWTQLELPSLYTEGETKPNLASHIKQVQNEYQYGAYSTRLRRYIEGPKETQI